MSKQTKYLLFKSGILIFFMLLFFRVQSQTFIIHKVQAGQSLKDLSKIYQVAPSDIIKYNSDLSIDTQLKPGQSILIPKMGTGIKTSDSVNLSNIPVDYKYHTAGDNETLFSLSKQYRSKIEDIVKLNNIEGYNIKLGQILIIPIYADKNAPKSIDTLKYTYYEVQPKQGKWRVAYDHGITIEELERLNPEIKKQTLKKGQKLIVPKFVTTKETDRDEIHFIYHDVHPKETLYSLSKQYNVSIEDIKKLNPEVTQEGLKFGQTIKLPRQNDEENSTIKPNDLDDKIKVLTQSDKKQIDSTKFNRNPFKINLLDSMRLDRTYHVAILLPFNLKSLKNEENICERITKNRILDYYSGIKLAIDSLKNLGLNVNYDVFDTQASPYITGKILEETDLSDYDFVIGPVKKDNIEKVAHILEYDNTPVAVHHYKGNKIFRNLVVTTTDNRALKNHMIQYIKEQAPGKNVDIIYDPTQKKEANSLAVSLGIPVKKIVGKKTKKGLLIYADDIKNAIDTNKENLIILLSNDNSFIFSVLSTLNSLNKNNKITLFTLDDKKLYEDDANDRMNGFLSNLNYHFPSKMIRLLNTDLTKKYKSIYHTLPDFTTINGFDTTFDLLVRAANADNLFEVLQKIGRTAQTSKIYLYEHTPDKGFKNQGSIILKIGADLGLHKVE